jgi:sulfite reductase alpha subunit-like flavoprotein
VLAEFASDESEKAELLTFCSLQDKSHYRREIEEKRPSLLDLLNHFKSSLPALQRLMLVLPPVKKRWYGSYISLCRSLFPLSFFYFSRSISPFVSLLVRYSQTVFSHESDATVEIAMTIVKEQKHAPFVGHKEGLCSHWMKKVVLLSVFLSFLPSSSSSFSSSFFFFFFCCLIMY